MIQAHTHRLHSSSFSGLPYRILKYKPQRGTTMEPMVNDTNSISLSTEALKRAPTKALGRDAQTLHPTYSSLRLCFEAQANRAGKIDCGESDGQQEHPSRCPASPLGAHELEGNIVTTSQGINPSHKPHLCVFSSELIRWLPWSVCVGHLTGSRLEAMGKPHLGTHIRV